MAHSLSVLSLFVLCLSAVEGFPNARRSDRKRAYVVHRVPSCIEAPKNDVCDLGYKIQAISNEKFQNKAATFKALTRSFAGIFPQTAPCPRLINKALCQLGFPECLPGARLNYGDRDKYFREIEKECVYNAHNGVDNNVQLGRILVQQLKPTFSKTGVQNFSLVCRYARQDSGQKCPTPKYPMPSRSDVGDYYTRIDDVTREMAIYKDQVPEECAKKALDILGCSYRFCSADRTSVLMQTTEEDCRGIAKCFTKHQAPIHEKFKKFLDDACSKFPSPDRNEEVDLPF